MVHSGVGYCSCGQEIWIEYLFSSGAWIHRFFDENQCEISQCPGCGATLAEDDLESI